MAWSPPAQFRDGRGPVAASLFRWSMPITVHRLVSILCLSAAALVLIDASINAQSPGEPAQEAFRSSVDLVTIQASVRDSRGRIVQGLRPGDFEVRDNGELRPVVELRSDQESPVSLAILVDMSGSMRVGPKIEMARHAFNSVLAQLRAGDEAAVFTFDSSLHERQGFTGDLFELTNALAAFEPFGTTSLYDAIAASAKRIAERTGTHRALVVLTDGTDTSSSLTAEQVSGIAGAIDVPVFVVATTPSIDQRAMLEAVEKPRPSGAVDLRDLAEWTGGQLVFASTFVDNVAATSMIVDGLRQQYVLAIEAASASAWHRLDVRVKTRSATVRARSGYFGG